jgi:hypothetical protein
LVNHRTALISQMRGLLERRNTQCDLAQEFWNGLENQTSRARWISEKFLDCRGRQWRPRRDLVWRLMRHKQLPTSQAPHIHTHSSDASLSNCSAAFGFYAQDVTVHVQAVLIETAI